MSPAAEHLYQSALTLPEAEQVALADALLAGPDHPPVPGLTGEAYLAELHQRSAQSDEVVWSNWEEARSRVHRRLGLTVPGDDIY
jgi:hypothetical protein